MRKLGECRLLTLASEAYIAQRGEPSHPLDLRQHECLIYASDTATSTWIYREGTQTVQVPVHGRIVANNGAALMEAAVRGMGLARQPDFIAAPYLASGQVRQVLQRFEIAPPGHLRGAAQQPLHSAPRQLADRASGAGAGLRLAVA